MFTYKAIRTTELLVMHKKKFKEIFFSEFKEIGDEFSKSSYSRFKKTKKIVKEAQKFCERNFRNFHPEFTDKNIQKRLKKKTLLTLTVILTF